MQGAFLLTLVLYIMLCKINSGFLYRGVSRPVLSMGLRAASTANEKANTYSRNPCAEIKVSALPTTDFSGDLLVVPFYKPTAKDGPKLSDEGILKELQSSIPSCSSNVHSLISDILQDGAFKADINTKQLVHTSNMDSCAKYIALVGLGPDPKKGRDGELDVKSASRLGKAVASLAKEVKAVSVAVSLPTGTENAGVSPLLMAVHDALYVDERFKRVPEEGFPPLAWRSMTLLGCSPSVVDNIALTDRLTSMIASGVQYAKDLVGEQLVPISSHTIL